MVMVDDWAREHKDPIPLGIMLDRLKSNPRTVRASVASLCKKGYLRRSYAQGKLAYIKLRSIG